MDASDLRDRFRGDVLERDGAGYEEARAIFNSMIDRQPALIAQCEDPDDVAAALSHARAQGLEVSIRSGGHSVTGASLSEGGLTVDMRRMNAVTVDPGARAATVQGRVRPGQRLSPASPDQAAAARLSAACRRAAR